LLSIGTVEPIEYGLKYNSISKTIDRNKVYTGGWHWVWPWYNFIVFPATLVNLDFTDYKGAQSQPLNVKDNNGQTMRLSVSLQYRIKKDKIPELYSAYQKGYETTMISFVDATVRTMVGTFGPDDFWTKRKEKGDQLREAINTKFEQIFVDCVSLQVIQV
jgi:regulator of protease activity HflC (stomatin/prohibitin superfamily)